MFQPSQYLRLTAEPEVGGALGELRAQHLERHLPSQGEVGSLIHHSHPAPTQQRPEPVAFPFELGLLEHPLEVTQGLAGDEAHAASVPKSATASS